MSTPPDPRDRRESTERERRTPVRESSSRKSLQSLMEVPAAVSILRGRNHVFKLVNPHYAKLFPNRVLLGKPVRQALPELEGQGYFELLDRVYSTGEPCAGREASVMLDRRGDGTLEPAFFNFVYQPTRDGLGRVDGVLVFAFDVTEFVEAQRRSEALAEALREMNREKDDFLAVVSHELRTPLTSILGWTRMLKLGHLDEETFRIALDSIERSTKSQAQLIEDLLDASRIAAGKLVLNRRPLRLGEVVAAAVAIMSPAAESKGLTIETEIDPEPLIVSGDPTRLQQVVTNLLSNAVKFTGPQGRVSVRLLSRNGIALIEVRDDGRGIAPEFMPHLFDRFRQDGNTSSDRKSGLGLGLSISRQLVEMHGGSIAASSAGVGKGATFTVELPLFLEAKASTFVEREDDERYASLPSLAGVRVLVVEDENDNRDVIAAVLLRCGAEVETASTAGEALEKIPAWRPDAIVADIALPGADG
ncbi:MAG TPA: ATP-binding protein, partial [Thermoanaerobaculia bacterium]